MAATPWANMANSSSDRSDAASWPPQLAHWPVGETVVGPTSQLPPLALPAAPGAAANAAAAAGEANSSRTRRSVVGLSTVSSEPMRRSTPWARSQLLPAAAACSSRANSASVRSSCCAVMASSTAQRGGGSMVCSVVELTAVGMIQAEHAASCRHNTMQVSLSACAAQPRRRPLCTPSHLQTPCHNRRAQHRQPGRARSCAA